MVNYVLPVNRSVLFISSYSKPSLGFAQTALNVRHVSIQGWLEELLRAGYRQNISL